MQNVGIWAIAQLREGVPDFKYGVFKLPTPPGRKYITIGGGWAFVANARGWNTKAAGEFCAWALASPKDGSVGRIVDWCTKAKCDMPPTKSALEAGKAAFQSGFLQVFTDEIYPSARAEPRMPPPVYTRQFRTRSRAAQLNGRSLGAGGSGQPPTRSDAFLSGYKGAPIL